MSRELTPAINVATALQSRVGTTLNSLQFLTPEQSTPALLSAGATSVATAVLTSIKTGQDKILEATNRVVELIQTQVDIQEEAERRAREALAEKEKEKPMQGPMPIPIEGGPDDGKFKLDKEGLFSNLDIGDIAAMATAGGLLMKNVAKRVIKGGARGGFYAVLASFLAKPAIDFLEEGVLKIDIPEETEKKLESAIIAGAGAYALAGIPGALVAFGAVGVNSLIDYLNGEQEKLSAMDASMLFAGGIGVKLLSAKAVTALTAAGWVKTAGILGAITATPVLIAVGVGIALGVAVNELVKFNERVQERTLQELEEITAIGQKELSKRFAKQKENFLEEIGAGGLGNMLGMETSDLTKTNIATEQALDTFKDDPTQFDSNEQKNVLKALDGILLAGSDNLQEILKDQSKTNAMLDTINAARQLAVANAFGEEKSKELLVKLLKFGSNIQVESKRLKARDEGTFISDRLAEGEGDLLEVFNNTYLGAQKTIDKNLALIEEKDKEINKLKALEEEQGKLSREDDKKLTRLEFDRRALRQEITRMQVIMKEFSVRGLYKEGALGFKMEDFTSKFSDEELQNLIKGALKNELLKMVNQDINEAATTGSNPDIDVKTGITSTSQSVKHGDTIINNHPDHTVDGHLTKVHPIYGSN